MRVGREEAPPGQREPAWVPAHPWGGISGCRGCGHRQAGLGHGAGCSSPITARPPVPLTPSSAGSSSSTPRTPGLWHLGPQSRRKEEKQVRDEDWVWRPGCPKTALGHLSTWGSSGQGLPFPEGYQSDSLCPHTEKPLGGSAAPPGPGLVLLLGMCEPLPAWLAGKKQSPALQPCALSTAGRGLCPCRQDTISHSATCPWDRGSATWECARRNCWVPPAAGSKAEVQASLQKKEKKK